MLGNLLRVLIFIDRHSRVDIPVVIASLIIYRKRKQGEESMAVRTTLVTLKDGREGRGVKVSTGNYINVADWAGGVPLQTHNRSNGAKDQRVKVKTKKGFRVARAGDVVVKLSKDDIIVIKADQFADLVSI